MGGGGCAWCVVYVFMSVSLSAFPRLGSHQTSYTKNNAQQRPQIVCESRPLYEGARAAAALAEIGYDDVTLITDAQVR